MAKKERGSAEYRAIRNGNLVRLIAHGDIPYFNIKVDFEQLPLRITPPHFGFFFLVPEIVFGGPLPFVHEESFPYPHDADNITVVDSAGAREIHIESVTINPPQLDTPARDESGYCVFTHLATDQHIVGRCDAPVLGVYKRSFGPGTYGECIDFIASN